jgi:alginate O-acetyltransferase complex protein AlgI
MLFNSPIFLFGFLPIVLAIYFLSPKRIRNTVLLLASLIFYAWGEVFYVGIMLACILSSYCFGLLIHKHQTEESQKSSAKYFLLAGLVVNLEILILFKYSGFIKNNINILLGAPQIDLGTVYLPLGISFFTFQAISYLVDIYRKEVEPQRNLFDLALYISLFPQLIAGPIVRYQDIQNQIRQRYHSIQLFSNGVRLFIFGLAKKMLIANTMGEVSDSVFSLPDSDINLPLAWIGILAYTLQIYFDFSGYSDMAIGLGHMFGFQFKENFNYPYIATSLKEFWSRWHISLSTWFRDYVYIPLGGNRSSEIKTYRNLLLVFLLTGIWHGASWTFILWGIVHGVFLSIERLGLGKLLKRIWKPLQHFYLLLVVVISWVLFRSESLPQAIHYLHSMFTVTNYHTEPYLFAKVFSREAIFVVPIGILLSTPIYPKIEQQLTQVYKQGRFSVACLVSSLDLSFLACMFLLSVSKIASSTYEPFIYFRF